MTESNVEVVPAEELVNAGVPAAEPEQPEAEGAPEMAEVHCRWCGHAHDSAAGDSEDWLCEHCERYQDAMTCPTCGQLARASALPGEMVPEAHAPVRRRKVKE